MSAARSSLGLLTLFVGSFLAAMFWVPAAEHDGERLEGPLSDGSRRQRAVDRHLLHLPGGHWVNVSTYFSSNMVLQRQATNCIWGWASDATVSIRLGLLRQEGTATALLARHGPATVDPVGHWKVCFAEPIGVGAHTAMTLEVQAGTGGDRATVAFHNVVWGDVFLCSGQSNMWWPAHKHVPTPLLGPRPNLRLLLLREGPADAPLREPPIQLLTPDDVPQWALAEDTAKYGEFSAFCYMTAALISDQLTNHSVPVPYIGLISGAMKDQAISRYLPAAVAVALNMSRPPLLPVCQMAIGGTAGLWNAFFAPLAGVPLAGVLWYQGESDTVLSSRYTYRCSLATLIASWRTAFPTPRPPLPVVLPILHPYHCKVPLGNAVVRDQQLAVAAGVPGVLPVAAWDTTHKVKSHPRDKTAIANRASSVLAARLYRLPIPHSGPQLVNVSCAVPGSRSGYVIRLLFRGARRLHRMASVNGLGRCLTSPFAVRTPPSGAVQDGQWQVVPLDGVQLDPVRSVVELTGEVLSNGLPDQVRYAYFNAPRCTLYDTASWPAMPFTDLPTGCPEKPP